MFNPAPPNEDADFVDLVERTNAFFRKHARISNGHRVRELKPRLMAKLQHALEEHPEDAFKAAHLVFFPKSSKKDIIKEFRATLETLAEYLFTGQGTRIPKKDKVKIFTTVAQDRHQEPSVRNKALEVLKCWGLTEYSNVTEETFDPLANIAKNFRISPQMKWESLESLFDFYDEIEKSSQAIYWAGFYAKKLVNASKGYLIESGEISSKDEYRAARRLASLMSNKNRYPLTYNHSEAKVECTKMIADIILSGMLTSQEAIDTLTNIVLDTHTREQQDIVDTVIDKVKGTVKSLKTRVRIIREMTDPGYDSQYTDKAATNLPEAFKLAAHSPEGRHKKIAMAECFKHVAGLVSPQTLIEYIKNDKSGFRRPEKAHKPKEINCLKATFEAITDNKSIPQKARTACHKAAEFLSIYISANRTSKRLAR